MAKKTGKVLPEIYQLKITLLRTSPPIWRRLLVPSDSTLGELHLILRIAMGWDGYHLHAFRIGQRHFMQYDPAYSSDLDAEDEDTVQLSAVLGRVGAKAAYTYDFGDCWNHSVTLEKILPVDPGRVYPACTGGKRRCPPDDCGGVYAYYELLHILHHPGHERYQELSTWVGEGFDPEEFSVEAVNLAFASGR